jgi:hypothetical protein
VHSLEHVTVYLNRRVPLANGRGTALVHAMDYELVSQYVWSLSPQDHTSYARRRYRGADGRWSTQYMHPLVSGQKNADHKNLNGLDNRRSNLRPADNSHQGAHRGKPKNNMSGFIGVHWDKANRKWRGEVWKDGKRAWSVWFDDDAEVAAVPATPRRWRSSASSRC